MKISIRAILVGAALAVGLTGCSSGSESLRLVPSGAARNEAAMDASKGWAPIAYEVQGELPEMPTEFVAYRYDTQEAPLAEAEAIAKVFGLEGEMVVDTNAGDTYEEISSYRIGNGDYSTPGMWMNGNGSEWWWNYYPGDGAYGDAARSTVSSEPCPPDDPNCESVSPEPPKNLPSKAEVEKLSTDFLTAIGVDLSLVDTQIYVDEWSAWSYSTQRVNDIQSPISWSFSYGENSVLLSASGVIAEVSEDETYPLADATEAVGRLDDYRYSGWGGAVSDVARASSSYMTVDDVVGEDSAIEPLPAETDGGDGSSGSSPGDTAVDNEPVPIEEPKPIDDEPMPEPEPVVIAITSVRMSYISSRTADGKDLLLPAFTYSNTDGDVGTVIALSDDVFTFEEESPPDTSSIEPMPEPGVDPGMSEPIPVEKANTLVGLTEDEAMALASESGWEYRVAARDGESFMLTTDYVTNRVNVVIEDGVITEVTVGWTDTLTQSCLTH